MRMHTTPFHLSRQLQRAFTLVELMVVVAIIGILAAFAYPSYTSYVLKSHRADALNALSQNQVILERCYAQNFTYNQACASLPAFPLASPQAYYTITLPIQTATAFTLTATAIGTQVQDTSCATLSVDQANQQTAFDNGGTAQTVCWHP
ncbi:type IV pilin protein [Glaciimonas sp. CA11.2]|uniref:type IV pilin protein n=1 Tax=unclassified Glaciimonas TaxID=2644401 RepID=UPI002AB432FA|nr:MULTISPECIES: type IV pilin protein [unclassified Glaciimonas]MDY7546200.1 type IV pilin protein [Glaciimonas sp. CA11.2]MEB0010850.1 type IV pilin protein [Glaciimonas sp. Cout2]MEB0081631.1 type IV pilin protein [Glaciimonas sp. Gout2]MEB0161730.1 type IV pilin protein [Glaciimonas sp. CA11.2]